MAQQNPLKINKPATYNERLKNCKKITKNSTDKVKYEIIVIDDGSTDQTKKLLEDNKNLYNKLLVNDYNKGKGSNDFNN